MSENTPFTTKKPPHSDYETPSCEPALNVADVIQKPKISVLAGEPKGESGDPIAYASPDSNMTKTLDCGTGTIVEETDKHTNQTVPLGVEEPAEKHKNDVVVTTGYPGSGPHLLPTALKKAETAIKLHKEGVAFTKRSRDGIFEHIPEEMEKEDCGIDTTSHTDDENKDPSNKDKTNSSPIKHRCHSLAFTVPGKKQERKDGKHADIDEDNTTNDT